MSTSIILANPSLNGDPTDPPLTTPPVGALSTLVPMVNVVTDQTAPPGPGLGTNSNQNGIIRIDETVGGSTTARNKIVYTTGLSKRPAAFLRQNWQAMPMPFNRLQGRVGYQSAARDLQTRIATQDATIIPTPAETAAAAVSPGLINQLNIRRGGRFSR